MKKIKFMFSLVACIVVISSYQVQALDKSLPTQIRSMRIIDQNNLEVTADKPLTYTYYKVTEPYGVVIDIAMADASGFAPSLSGSGGNIINVAVDIRTVPALTFTRLRVSLKDEADINVSEKVTDQNRLLFAFIPLQPSEKKEVLASTEESIPGKSTAVAPETAPATTQVKEAIVPAAESASAKVPQKTSVETPAIKAPSIAASGTALAAAPAVKAIPVLLPPPTPGTNGATKKIPPKPVVPQPSTTRIIKGIKVQHDGIEIFTDYSVYNYKSFTLTKPGRLVLDFPMAHSSIKAEVLQLKRFGVRKAKIGTYPDKLRLVFEAAGNNFPAHTLLKSEDGLKITFKDTVRGKK
jgi:type IV pilus assembly protein PilQ